jgi:hypothetical protein
MHEIDWEKQFYPLYGTKIILPKDTILWRGHSTDYPTLQNRPTFFGSKETASGYSRQNNTTISSFITQRPLRIIDIRFLKVLLKELFQGLQNKKLSEKDINMIKASTISLGTSSLKHQIELIHNVYGDNTKLLPGFKALEDYYNSLHSNLFIEHEGVRIGETLIDGYTMSFIKGLFDNTFDGVISPRVYSPFHIEKENTNSPELLLFSPHKDVLQIPINSIPKTILSIPINGLILKNNYIYTTNKIDNTPFIFYMRGGGTTVPTIDRFNEMLDTNNSIATKHYTCGYNTGLKWRKYVTAIEPPAPCCPVEIFSEDE